MTTDTITIPKGTYAVRLYFLVRNADDTPYDLTGLTVTFKAWTRGAPGALYVTGACVVPGATDGICYFAPLVTDFVTIGQYDWELEMTKAGFVDNTISGLLFVTESG